jgi:hypothetical protein
MRQLLFEDKRVETLMAHWTLESTPKEEPRKGSGKVTEDLKCHQGPGRREFKRRKMCDHQKCHKEIQTNCHGIKTDWQASDVQQVQRIED